MSAVANSKRPNESEMAKLAEKVAVNARDGVEKGKRLPEDFVNPPLGDRKHLCLDLQGRYAPHWSQVQIVKGDLVGGSQFFNSAGRKKRLKVGVWGDCPPEVVEMLQDTVVEEMEMDIDAANPLVTDHVATVVNTIPRFNVRVIPSA